MPHKTIRFLTSDANVALGNLYECRNVSYFRKKRECNESFAIKHPRVHKLFTTIFRHPIKKHPFSLTNRHYKSNFHASSLSILQRKPSILRTMHKKSPLSPLRTGVYKQDNKIYVKFWTSPKPFYTSTNVATRQLSLVCPEPTKSISWDLFQSVLALEWTEATAARVFFENTDKLNSL